MIVGANFWILGAIQPQFHGSVGNGALVGAMLTAFAVVAAAIAYLLVRNGGLIRFIQLGLGLLAACLSVASWALLRALLTDDFSLACVVGHSEKSLGLMYKIAAFWAGQEGALRLWAWVLGLMGVLMAWKLRKAEGAFSAVTLGVMALATGFFVALMLGVADPFKPALEAVKDGHGLNPALQNLAMVFHPPMLFLGYAGFTAPFAYLLGGLF